MSKFSYSKVDCYKQCPYRYYLRYIKKLNVLPSQDADNALYIGSALHKGIETDVEKAINEYHSHYYVLTNDIINWSIQIAYWVPKVKEALPFDGKNEVKIDTNGFIGFIDYLTDDTIWDFKFTVPKNYGRYLESKQLHLYKHYLEKQNPDVQIEHLKYVFIPKSKIRQKKTETLEQFRQRLYEEMNKLKIEIVEIPFDESSITLFANDCKAIETATEYPKCESALCRFCDYKEYCLEREDWNTYED